MKKLKKIIDVKISKATGKEIAVFSEKFWMDENIEHYGKPVKWLVKQYIFKATRNKKILGYIKGKFVVGVIYINTIIVDKNFRKKGIGKMLIKRVEEYAQKMNAHKIYFFTMETWAASKFYKKLGYNKSGILKKHYLKKDFVIYTKFINREKS